MCYFKEKNCENAAKNTVQNGNSQKTGIIEKTEHV